MRAIFCFSGPEEREEKEKKDKRTSPVSASSLTVTRSKSPSCAPIPGPNVVEKG